MEPSGSSREVHTARRKQGPKGIAFLQRFRKWKDEADGPREHIPRSRSALYEPSSPIPSDDSDQSIHIERFDSTLSEAIPLKIHDDPALRLAESIAFVDPDGSDGEMSLASDHSEDSMRSLTYIDFPNGDMYEGAMKEGRLHGLGVLRHADGRVYKGDFVNNNKHGMGITLFPGGNKHIGQYENGFMSGRGTLLFMDGKRYVGNFLLDHFHGEGVITFVDKGQFHGTFFRGLKVHGCYISSDGVVCVYDGAHDLKRRDS